MLHLEEGDNEREIELSVGEEFEIHLLENPTTGFQWLLISNGEPACTLQSNFFETASGPPGRGGSHYWRFQAVQVGIGHIDLVYKQPWVQEKTPARRVTLHARIHAS